MSQGTSFDNVLGKPQTVRAKFKCNKVSQITYGTDRVLYEVEMQPVYSQKEGSENKAFWDATPSGSFKMASIISDYFEINAEYYLDITKAPDAS